MLPKLKLVNGKLMALVVLGNTTGSVSLKADLHAINIESIYGFKSCFCHPNRTKS